MDLEKLETLTKQIELDRIAEEFKKLHVERQNLVSRWQVIFSLSFVYIDILFITFLFIHFLFGSCSKLLVTATF